MIIDVIVTTGTTSSMTRSLDTESSKVNKQKSPDHGQLKNNQAAMKMAESTQIHL